MTTFKIVSWDGIVSGNDINPHPSISFVPSLAFLDFAKLNDYIVSVVITDTNSTYDNVVIQGIAKSSGNVPPCRPNFYAETGLWSIILNFDWLGFPLKMGKVKIVGLNGVKGEGEGESVEGTPLVVLPGNIEGSVSSDSSSVSSGVGVSSILADLQNKGNTMSSNVDVQTLLIIFAIFGGIYLIGDKMM